MKYLKLLFLGMSLNIYANESCKCLPLITDKEMTAYIHMSSKDQLPILKDYFKWKTNTYGPKEIFSIFVSDSQRYVYKKQIPILNDTATVLTFTVSFDFVNYCTSNQDGDNLVFEMQYYTDGTPAHQKRVYKTSDLIVDSVYKSISVTAQDEIYITCHEKNIQLVIDVFSLNHNCPLKNQSALVFTEFKIQKTFDEQQDSLQKGK